MGIVIAVLVIGLGIAGYVFRDKIFPPPPPPPAKSNILTPEQIAKDNEDKVVQIEFGWQLRDASSDAELWHAYVPSKNQNSQYPYRALYFQNGNGQYEPYLVTKSELDKLTGLGAPLGFAGATGSGFVVSPEGFILTNRHVAATWLTSYHFADYAFPGATVKWINGKPTIDEDAVVSPNMVSDFVPANASMVNGRPVSNNQVRGKNTYLNVIFSNTSMRIPMAGEPQPSENHDVALIKINAVQSLPKVTMLDNYGEVKPGQSVTVMGFPGIAPEQYVVRKSNDVFNGNNKVTTVPTTTVTTGNIGRIIPASSDKDLTYSSFGDAYQLTINATGAGNSGGPMFDDKGNVIGIFFAGKADEQGTKISFAVPIKYGMELMGIRKINK